MNRFVRNSIATGLAALTVAGTAIVGPALARQHDRMAPITEDRDSRDAASDLAPSSGRGGYGVWPWATAMSDADAIDQQIRRLPASRFSVVAVDTTRSKGGADVIGGRVGEPGYLTGVRRAIGQNHPLVARLEARNVEIGNVIGAEPAGDGSMIFYIR